MRESENQLERLLEIMRRLRGPGGCPWDQKQSSDSIKMYAIEEAYEVVEAIESGSVSALEEELGDLLLQVVFHARCSRRRVDLILRMWRGGFQIS